jgi:hypothetical protein
MVVKSHSQVRGPLAMSTFYVIPPRPLVGQQFAQFLQAYFPGLDWNATSRAELAETLGTAGASRADVFVVFREDLPEGVEVERALVDGFGAAAGDEIVEATSVGFLRYCVAKDTTAIRSVAG